ncbi:uncharacterized protein [Choristoneura fumiferana]|uniref:uncharacterized protein n=1 Tax=Choristoneura fumiferana TaxID=7141 RepID=UPI003D15A0A7
MSLTQSITLLIIINSIFSEAVTNNRTQAISVEAKNAFKFEGQSDAAQSYGLIRFEDEDKNKYYNNEDYNEFNKPLSFENKGQGIKFNEPLSFENKGQSIKFEEENRIENQRPNHQKKKRKRRKPKRIISNGVPYFQNGLPGSFGRPGSVQPGPIYPGQSYPPYPGIPGPVYKPRPSPTSAALSAVTEALTSIALYDDRQCVPRLLCEAAGGAGGTASGLLQSISGLQPLLTLLAAYNGISSSPLFVFGRAVFLGMTSKANPGTCRYAYPDCPNDPEELVHYLNNHNGGFFRFFAAPQLNQQQGLEQFYNQLSGQNYGYYQPQQNLEQAGYGQLQQNYQYQQLQGAYPQQQGVYQGQNLQQQGLYQNQNVQQQGFYHNVPQVGYGQNVYQNQNFGHHNPNLYGNSYGFYGKGYPYQNANFNRFKSSTIQKRIQNTPGAEYVKNNENSKWLFPESSIPGVKDVYDQTRLGKVLKFPESSINSVIGAEGFTFPGIQSNREYLFSNIEAETEDFFDVTRGVNGYRNENYYNHGLHGSNSNNYDNSNNVRTLYIVRGNGDPNNPEIVHLAAGQTL